MGRNRKVKLLVYEFFRGGREIQKGHFFSSPSWTQLHEIKRDGKMDLLIEKTYLILAG